MNADWHRKHKMPRNPTKEQRIAWHVGHAAACGCRPVPEKLRAEIVAYIAGNKANSGKIAGKSAPQALRLAKG